MMAVHTQGRGLCGDLPARGCRNKGGVRSSNAPGRAVFRCSRRWSPSNLRTGRARTASHEYVQPSSRSRAHGGVSRGDVSAIIRTSTLGAPALRAGARSRRRADSCGLRRRSAAAPAAISTDTSTSTSRAVHARPAEGAGTDARVPPRAADGGAAGPERAAARKCSRATCSRPRSSSPSPTPRELLAAQGDHTPRRPAIHLARHQRSVPPSPTGAVDASEARRTRMPRTGERGRRLVARSARRRMRST